MPRIRIVSLGAGVQSTTMLLMGLEGAFGEKPDAAIFADTQWEPKAVYDHLEWLERQVAPFPIHRASAGNLRDAALQTLTHGGKPRRRVSLPVYVAMPKDDPLQKTLWQLQPAVKPGALIRQCTGDFKIDVIRRATREMLGVGARAKIDPGTVEQWVGISTDEASRMNASGVKYVTNRYPLIEAGMSRDDCLEWLSDRGYPKPPKSACIGCPFTSDARYADMKANRPEEFEDAVAFDEAIRHNLVGVEHPVYLHRSLMPLRQVAFNGKDDDWTGECSGMCGV